MPDSSHKDYIRLDQFLKLQGVCGTGGQAKIMIQNGEVGVNGQIELRRGRKLVPGDVIATGGMEWTVATTE